jgi:hypothetical protein
VTLMQKHFNSPREYAKWLRTHPPDWETIW